MTVLLITGIVASSVSLEYRSMEINAYSIVLILFHDIDNIKKATILWSCVHWSKPGISMLNDNAFVFNRMLGHNTAIYDDVDKNGNLVGSMILPQRATSSLVIFISHIFSQLQMKLTKMLTLMITLISLSENQCLFINRNIIRDL